MKAIEESARLIGSPNAAGSANPEDRRLDARQHLRTAHDMLATIGAAVTFAEASPFPAPEQALEDMYAA